MVNHLRGLVSHINNSVASRFTATRKNVEVAVDISIEPNRNDLSDLRARHTGELKRHGAAMVLKGETHDISRNGIAFYVPFLRLGENYVAGNTTLHLDICLPNGRVHLEAVAERYNPIEKNGVVTKYLVGARIVKVDSADSEIFDEFLAETKRGSIQTIGVTQQPSRVSSFLGLW